MMASNIKQKDILELETILDYIRYGFSKANALDLFFGHGTDNAWDDILELILGSLSLPFNFDPQFLMARLTTDEKIFLGQQLEKRLHYKIPVPYLTKRAYFCELPFYVDERVLIPRSPISELIQQQFSPWIDPSQVKQVLDLCTGSACIAIACCYAFPEAQVDAVDLSTDALDVAVMNQVQHGVSDQLTLIHSDCFSAVSDKRYDIIVSNPPYVSAAEMETLPEEYAHEPNMALEAEQEGLKLVIEILNQASKHLTDQGILVVEVGNTADTLIATFPEVPFTWLEFERGGEGVFLLTQQQLLTCKGNLNYER